MQTQALVTQITNRLVDAAQSVLGSKLDKIVLYGSYARGDFDAESDMDFAIIADIPFSETKQWRRAISEQLPRLDLDYDILVSYQVKSRDFFYQHLDVLPYYRNVEREGVVVHG